ncbi:MAG: GNAT family N-acetyltransferase [Nitriliruptoraceae bacterium]
MSALPHLDPSAPQERVRVRSLRPEDAARVGQLTLAGYDRYGRIEGPYRDHLADPLQRIDGCTALLVAELDGEVVGTVTFVLPGDREWEGRAEPQGDASFRMLAVAPTAEGHGVGRALVAACIGLARGQGCRRLVIVTMAWMGRAQRMYARLGFRRRPDLDVRFPSGDGYVLTLDLTPDAHQHFPLPGPTPDPLPWFTEVWAG